MVVVRDALGGNGEPSAVSYPGVCLIMSAKAYALAASLLMAVAMWLWVQRVAIPHQQQEAATLGTPRGNLSDLYPRWLGARELLLHHRDPYSPEITREIQTGYYGRPIDPSRPNDPKDQQAFAYPAYVVFLLAPTVNAPFPMVQRLFFALLVAMTAASVWLWLGAIRWRITAIEQAIWIVLVLGSFPAIQGLKLQQLSIVVAFLLAAGLFLLTRGRLAWAGALLALATIKPQLALLPAAWLCLWVLGDVRRRRRFLWSFLLTMAALILGAEFVLPGWIGKFRAASAAYYVYTGGGRSVLDVLLTPLWGRIISAALVVILLFLLWRNRRAQPGTAEFNHSLALVFATTLVVIPMFAPYNQILLLPSLMVIVASLRDLWRNSRLSRFLTAAAGLAVLWPWFAAVALVLVRLTSPEAASRAWALPMYTTFAIPITALAVTLLMRTTPHR